MNDEIKTDKNRGIINYFRISSERIFFALLSIFLFYLILLPKYFDIYISIFIFLIITTISSYFRIKKSYFIFFGFFLILCALAFIIFINKNISFIFFYHSIFFIILFFLSNPLYRYLDNIKKGKKRYLLNPSYTIILIIILTSLFGYIFGPPLWKACLNYGKAKYYAAYNDAGKTSTSMEIGKTYTIPITITNYGIVTWSSTETNKVNLSYHWYDTAGKIIVWNGKRISLLSDMTQGQTATINAQVIAPSKAGTYILKYDLVHENVTWFSQKNVPVLEKKVEVVTTQLSTNKILMAKEYYREGVNFFEKQNYKKAIEKFKLAISNDKKLTIAYYKLGEAYQLNGDIYEAEKNFKKALKLDPKFAKCYLSLGLLFEENNKLIESIENYKKAIEIDPNLSESIYHLGKIYYIQGEKEKAEEKFLELIKIGHIYPEAHFMLGKIYYEKGEYEKALDQFYIVDYMKGVLEFELPEGENLEDYIEELEKKLGI